MEFGLKARTCCVPGPVGAKHACACEGRVRRVRYTKQLVQLSIRGAGIPPSAALLA